LGVTGRHLRGDEYCQAPAIPEIELVTTDSVSGDAFAAGYIYIEPLPGHLLVTVEAHWFAPRCSGNAVQL